MKTIKLTSTGLTGKQWIKRLEEGGYKIGSYARELLESKEFKPSKKGKKYTVAFLMSKEVVDKSTQEIKGIARNLGYRMPDHETALLVREVLSDKQMEELGIWYVVALHDSITGSDGRPCVLGSDRDDDGRWVRADFGDPDNQWLEGGAFVFPVSASPKNLDTKSSSETLSLDLDSRVKSLEEQMVALRKFLVF